MCKQNSGQTWASKFASAARQSPKTNKECRFRGSGWKTSRVLGTEATGNPDGRLLSGALAAFACSPTGLGTGFSAKSGLQTGAGLSLPSVLRRSTSGRSTSAVYFFAKTCSIPSRARDFAFVRLHPSAKVLGLSIFWVYPLDFLRGTGF